MKNSFIIILSEIALALYPILIKTVPTDITTQLVSRTLTFSVLAFLLGSNTDLLKTWGDAKSIISSMLLGLVTLFHVGTSYYAFQELSTGVSMSIFYTYPFFNLLGGMLLYGEVITITQFILMVIAFTGVLLVAPEIREAFQEKSTTESKAPKEHYDWKALFSGLAAALSETIMYFAVKGADIPNPYFSMLQLYPGALILLLSIVFLQGKSIDTRSNIWLPMILFNSIIGFVGYAMRFYAIPKVSTIVFSLLSFIGVVAAFIWGYMFVNEIPSLKSLLGAAMITGAVGVSGAPI